MEEASTARPGARKGAGTKYLSSVFQHWVSAQTQRAWSRFYRRKDGICSVFIRHRDCLCLNVSPCSPCLRGEHGFFPNRDFTTRFLSKLLANPFYLCHATSWGVCPTRIRVGAPSFRLFLPKRWDYHFSCHLLLRSVQAACTNSLLADGY